LKAFDRYKKELIVGDNVVFTASGWLERGYIYKIINGKRLHFATNSNRRYL
jgi:hypothetical protein